MNYLVAFGFYDNPDEKQRLLSNLMRLMDGRNDKPKPTNEGLFYPIVINMNLEKTKPVSMTAYDGES